MDRLAARAVVDLVAAAGAIGDDERVGAGVADGGQQRGLGHFHRELHELYWPWRDAATGVLGFADL